MKKQIKLKKLTILAAMIALDVALSPLFRIEGMAPMSSVVNITAGVMMGPLYTTIMAFVCALIRMIMMGIPPLALTGAIFGAFLSGSFYKCGRKVGDAMLGEVIGTGLIGSLISYPVMVWFTGSNSSLSWLVYTPRFLGATIIGSIIASFVLIKLKNVTSFKKVQHLFFEGGKE